MHRTNVDLDQKLVREALRCSGAKTVKALLHEALSELVAARSRKDLRELRGKLRFTKGYDHKAGRRSRLP